MSHALWNQGYYRLIRPHQWIKNLFLFAPLFFGFDHDTTHLLYVVYGFILFSFAASAIYILNDYYDIPSDQAHPTKRHRPLASGTIAPWRALSLMGVLILIAVVGSWHLSERFGAIIISYILLMITYTYLLKHHAIIDISVIAVGFVLRIFAGASLIGDTPSMWIVLDTFLLALFLALAKRRDDCLLALQGTKTRSNIDGYTIEMVNAAMVLMAGVSIVAYIMYTVSPEVITRFGTSSLYLTAFFVILGFLRYMQLTFVEHKSGSPTKVVLSDLFLQLVILGWIGLFYLIIHGVV